jgi:hypothetical protein
MGRWKIGIWRLKCCRGNIYQGTRSLCRKGEGWSYILRCEETRSWRDKLTDKRITSIDQEI